MPDGASTFLLWCISRISMSKSSSSVSATRLTSAASRLTPRLMLPDFTIAQRLAASAISFSFSPDSPVVPRISALPPAHSSAKATRRRRHSEVDQRVGLGKQRRSIGGDLDPVRAEPRKLAGIATDHGEPGASTAPASAAPSVAAIAWISVRPMRPPAPATINRMSAMESHELDTGFARCQLAGQSRYC